MHEEQTPQAGIERDEAIGRLVASPDWEHLQDWFKEQRKQTLEAAVFASDNWERTRGFILGLDFLLDVKASFEVLPDEDTHETNNRNELED